jgi:short-subunit dehydrogenase
MQPRNAIVTGASHGIGPFIARALAARQMNMLLVARSEAELARLAAELGSAINVSAAAIDLGGPQAARQVADAAAAELGSVDVLVNNAATEPQTRFHALSPGEIEYVLRVDLISPLLLARLVLPGMLERGYGRIVNVSSLAGHTSFPHTEAYAAAKDGLTAFSRVLTSDYRHTGVSATSLILGPVKDAGVSARTLAETGPDRQHRLVGKPAQGGRRRPPRHRQAQAGDGHQRRPRPGTQSADGLLPPPGPAAQPAQRRRQAHDRGGRLPRSRPHHPGPLPATPSPHHPAAPVAGHRNVAEPTPGNDDAQTSRSSTSTAARAEPQCRGGPRAPRGTLAAAISPGAGLPAMRERCAGRPGPGSGCPVLTACQRRGAGRDADRPGRVRLVRPDHMAAAATANPIPVSAPNTRTCSAAS